MGFNTFKTVSEFEGFFPGHSYYSGFQYGRLKGFWRELQTGAA